MPLTAYQEVILPKIDTQDQLLQLIGVEQGFLSFYEPEPCDSPSQLEGADMVLIIPPQAAYFEELSQELILAQEVESIRDRHKETMNLLSQIKAVYDGSESVLAVVLQKMQTIKRKISALPEKFKPVEEAEAAQVQNIIKQEYPFIKERIEEHAKAVQALTESCNDTKK